MYRDVKIGCKILSPFPGFSWTAQQLLEKDFSNSIHCSFEATGLYSLNVERALSKLPKRTGRWKALCSSS
jgi:hypothetical protein